MEEKSNVELQLNIAEVKIAVDCLLDLLLEKQIINYEERCEIFNTLNLYN